MYTFHHRKLLDDSVVDSNLKFCQGYCDPLNNPDGSCPTQCLIRCFPICRNFLIDNPPPPILNSYDDDPPVSSHKHSIFFTLSLALLAATFLLFSIYTAYKFYQRRYVIRRNQPPRQAHPLEEVPIVREFSLDQNIGSVVDHPIWYIRTVGLQPAIISSIATCKYKRGDGLVEVTDCSVCLSEFQDDEILRLLPKCEHAFHISCIDAWLRSHTNCPLCRAPIVITTANSQSTERRAHGLSNVVESQIEESERDVEIEADDDNESRVEIGLRQSRQDDGSSGSQQWGEENDVHLLRRSVSMDSLAASAISAAIANAIQLRSERNSDKQLVGITTGSSTTPNGSDSSQKDLNSVCSSSNELKEPSVMVKRSLSCSAKVFLSRYSRSKSSTPPPPPPP